MLLRQNFGRRHEGRLPSVFRGAIAKRRRDRCFSRTDVALYEPVHRRAARHHIAHAVACGAQLRLCRPERQKVKKIPRVVLLHHNGRLVFPARLKAAQAEV